MGSEKLRSMPIEEQNSEEIEHALQEAMDCTIKTWTGLRENYDKLEKEYYSRLKKKEYEDDIQMFRMNSTDKKFILYQKNSHDEADSIFHLSEIQNSKDIEEYGIMDEKGYKEIFIREIKDGDTQEIIHEDKTMRRRYYLRVRNSYIKEEQLDIYKGKYQIRYYRNSSGKNFIEKVRHINKFNS